jgi:hypothetical protein
MSAHPSFTGSSRNIMAFLAQTARPIRVKKSIGSELRNYLSGAERKVVASIRCAVSTFFAKNVASENDAPCVLPTR